jgi:cell division protein FtsB
MSQTETVMLFVLGFCVALLIVLMFGRGIFGLLATWSGWREERKVPAAIRDLEAERDSLKAEKAMMAKRLESSTTDIKMRMAEQMAEVARNRNRVLDLTATLEQAKAEIAKLQDEGKVRVEQISALKIQIEENVRAINTAWQSAGEHEKRLANAATESSQLEQKIAKRDSQIANLENEAKALREIVAMFVPSSDDVREAKNARAAAAVIPIQESPYSIPPVVKAPTLIQPFKPVEAAKPEDFVLEGPDNDVPDLADQDAVTRSANNVLSLAERVRGLQSGMKRR